MTSGNIAVKKLNNFAQLLKELSMIKYDKDKNFDPKYAKFVVCRAGSFKEGKDSTPFPKLRKAYDDEKDVRYVDFYGTEIRIGVSFTDLMRQYAFGNVRYLDNRRSGYVEVTFPLSVLV